jgi:hypothetical protein
MKRLLRRFPSATDRDFFYWRTASKEEFDLYIRLRRRKKVLTPDEFKYVHLKRNRDMCYLMRWFRRSLNRSGVPHSKLPGNEHLMLHPVTAMRWIHDLALSKSFRRKWTEIHKQKWLKYSLNRFKKN